MKIQMELGDRSYAIRVEHGLLASAGRYLNLDRKVLIVTDQGVPAAYSRALAAQAREPVVVTLPQGEASKSFENYQALLRKLVEENFTRTDCVAAVGGGVVGDLAGFTAATYMRGIDFYNLPTTLLSQIDSSIGGKTAINFRGIKNIVGAFYQPRAVLIDPDVLSTLAPRQLSSGLGEAIKMALTCDGALFARMEQEDLREILDDIILGSLRIKKKIVEQDEKEAGLRRVLNFGHTIGHGIEARQQGALFHGECVALGMLPMCSPAVRRRLLPLLKKAGLPTAVHFAPEAVFEAVCHDKKCRGENIVLVRVETPGSFRMEEVPMGQVRELLHILEETP